MQVIELESGHRIFRSGCTACCSAVRRWTRKEPAARVFEKKLVFRFFCSAASKNLDDILIKGYYCIYQMICSLLSPFLHIQAATDLPTKVFHLQYHGIQLIILQRPRKLVPVV